MIASLELYKKSKDYLLCVDSDGCAINTMEVKHKECFGPCLVKEWELMPWEEEVLGLWNHINLYSLTRGINRFKGLSAALIEIDRRYKRIEGIDELKGWTDKAKILSDDALIKEMRKSGGKILQKALNWSRSVNQCISELSWDKKHPFKGVKDGFASVRDFANIVIVSSANRSSVEEEWEVFGLRPMIDMILCQDAGSKSHCIKELKSKGYRPDHILMVGDALGDRDAAHDNGVYFYPILVKREEDSWKEFAHAFQLFKEENYAEYALVKEKQFLENLTNNK